MKLQKLLNFLLTFSLETKIDALKMTEINPNTS